MKYIKLFEELDWRDFKDLEEFADGLFWELGLDIVFTKHFMDRVNDWREKKKPITYEELEDFFIKAYRKAGHAIKSLPHNKEAVLRDHWSRLNSPIIIKDRDDHKDVIIKTIMRNKNFESPDPIISI